jgi:hypothetical protein
MCWEVLIVVRAAVGDAALMPYVPYGEQGYPVATTIGGPRFLGFNSSNTFIANHYCQGLLNFKSWIPGQV